MVYFDSGATTLQKPPAVSRAVSYAVNHLASPGRGGYPAAMEAAQVAFRCREAAADLFELDDPGNVVFTSSATHGLNIAIRSLVKPGDTVVISGYEHNAVTRTLESIPGLRIRVAEGLLFDRDAMVRAFRDQIDSTVSVVICNHVSNVFGFVLPVEEISAMCRDRGIPFILDASQSAGCLPVSMRELGCAFIAMPGHKGLYGPQGTGILLCAQAGEPLLTGGTGSSSAMQSMPDFLPDRHEAGTHNVPGIAGLLEGLRFVKRQGPDRILAHEWRLARMAARGLESIPGMRVFSARQPECQTGVLSFLPEQGDVEQWGERLGEAGFALRAGLHCAPLAHRSAGTLESGTLRLSLSAFNQEGEVRRFVGTVRRLSAARR